MLLEFLICEPADAYHSKSKEYLTSHALADFRESPLLYRKRQLGLLKAEGNRAAFLIGQATHTLVLEGRQAYEEWVGRHGLTAPQAALVEEMAAAVGCHPIAKELLAEGVAEGVVRCEYRDIPCQARLDWLNPVRGLIDLKTCENLKFFENDVKTFGYVHQLAFYRALLAQVFGEKFPAYLVAVEKREPFRCGVWRIDPDVLDVAERENEVAIDRLAQCRQMNYWPTGYEELRVLNHI